LRENRVVERSLKKPAKLVVYKKTQKPGRSRAV